MCIICSIDQPATFSLFHVRMLSAIHFGKMVVNHEYDHSHALKVSRANDRQNLPSFVLIFLFMVVAVVGTIM